MPPVWLITGTSRGRWEAISTATDFGSPAQLPELPEA